jgi:hypothetical protein
MTKKLFGGFMNFIKRGLTLLLLASLTAGQAQAAEQTVNIQLTTDKVVGAIFEVAKMSGNKVVKLLEKKDFSAIVLGLSLGSLSYAIGSEERKFAQYAERHNDNGYALFWSLLAGISFASTAVIGAQIIETIYNA